MSLNKEKDEFEKYLCNTNIQIFDDGGIFDGKYK